jgi:hypothetical protein
MTNRNVSQSIRYSTHPDKNTGIQPISKVAAFSGI